MARFEVEVDVDITEIIEELTYEEYDELIQFLVDRDAIEDPVLRNKRKMQPSILQQLFYESLESIKNNYYILNKDQVYSIIEIARSCK